MEEKERRSEEARLQRTMEALRAVIAELEEKDDENRLQAEALNRGMWDEATHAAYDFNDVAELLQYHKELAFHNSWTRSVEGRLRHMRRMLASPYFGRVDFRADGKAEPRRVYIGVGSLTTPGTNSHLVHDWRAPVSSLFYDAEVGKAAYESPSGTIRGTLELKRQYKIKDGRLLYMLDAGLAVGDDILQRELAQSADGGLKVIVETIQREQNEAIRRNAYENLVVFGPAGSGKTSVGLHRLAYLLYRHRGSLHAADLLLFTQNRVFGSYIADTIPELGEEDVAAVGFADLARKYLGEYDRQSDQYEMLEYMGASGMEEPRRRGIGIKLSAAFLDFLRRYVPRAPVSFRDVVVFGATLCTGGELAARYASQPGSTRPAVRIAKLCDRVHDLVEDHFLRNGNELKAMLLRRMVDVKDVDGALARLREETIEQARAGVAKCAGLDAAALYEGALREYGLSAGVDGIEEALRFTGARLGEGWLLFEDAVALLCVKALTGEAEPVRTVRHVLADEAQDMSLPQHFALRSLFPSAAFTVLADTDQALFPEAGLRDEAALAAIYGGSTVRLTKSFRSTAQIADLAMGLLPGRAYARMDRKGERPVLLYARDAAAAVAGLLETPACRAAGSVGVLTASLRRAKELHGLLGQSGVDLRLIGSGSDAFGPGASVLPVTLAKGLEFDAVIVPDCAQAVFGGEEGARMLYLMCTRALHRLVLVCGGELPACLHPLSSFFDTRDLQDLMDGHLPSVTA